MEEVLSVEGIEGIEQVWAVGVHGSARLLCSTADESFLLQLEPEVEVLPLSESVSSRALLAAGTVAGQVMTISKAGVVLWEDLSGGVEQAQWNDGGKGVVAAQIHGAYAVVALRGGHVQVLQVADGQVKVVQSYVASRLVRPCCGGCRRRPS
jgi:hypothetical protein